MHLKKITGGNIFTHLIDVISMGFFPTFYALTTISEFGTGILGNTMYPTPE